MKIAIIYESLSGNTKKVAEELKKQLEKEVEVIYFGNPKDKLPKADIFFIGSWTDKGNASKKIQEQLKQLNNTKIAYFGTAGFRNSKKYYKQLFDRIKVNINNSNKILGYFFCQGKMPIIVKEKYEKQLKENPKDNEIIKNIENFEQALKHPNIEDFESAKKWSKDIIKLATR